MHVGVSCFKINATIMVRDIYKKKIQNRRGKIIIHSKMIVSDSVHFLIQTRNQNV